MSPEEIARAALPPPAFPHQRDQLAAMIIAYGHARYQEGRSDAALDELTAQAQALGLYD